MNKNILGGLVGIIIVGGGAFYAGDVYGKGAAAPAAGAARFAAGGMMGGTGTAGCVGVEAFVGLSRP